MIGEQFGRLTVLAEAGHDKYKRRLLLCRCACGVIKEIVRLNVQYGYTKSCGCLRKQLNSERDRRKHGMCYSPEYHSWQNMRYRCQTPTQTKYKDYGARGIKVCERWHKFENFFADMGPRPDGCSIDRIDLNGNYEPSNCRWATPKEQMNNTRRNVFYSHDGVTLTAAQWSRRTGIAPKTLHKRIKKWGIAKALTTPIKSLKAVVSNVFSEREVYP